MRIRAKPARVVSAAAAEFGSGTTVPCDTTPVSVSLTSKTTVDPAETFVVVSSMVPI